jgi:hypothetical protein
MLTLPAEIMVILHHFTPVLGERMWDWARVLLVGAILAPLQRTVSAILRVMGLSQERQFQNYHRVLNRARWSSLQVSRILLQVLVATFVGGEGTIVLGGDETLERRRGAKIAGLGCFRDAARSSRHNKVKSMGLRWVSLMLLTGVPWSRHPSGTWQAAQNLAGLARPDAEWGAALAWRWRLARVTARINSPGSSHFILSASPPFSSSFPACRWSCTAQALYHRMKSPGLMLPVAKSIRQRVGSMRTNSSRRRNAVSRR